MDKLLVKGKFALPVDRRVIARDWRSRGYGCDEFVDPPGREWTKSFHSTNELVSVWEGVLELTGEQSRVVAGPGDELFIPARALHSVKNIRSGTTRWLYGYD